MIIQLTSGKIIQISVEEYLNLSDEELDFLNNPGNNIGNYPNSIWLNSPIANKSNNPHEFKEELDYSSEDEEKFCEEGFTTDDPLIDELQDVPDEDYPTD